MVKSSYIIRLCLAASRLCINSLLNGKFLNWSKLKELPDDKIYMTEKFKFVLGRVENIVGKRENAGYQHFLLFLQCFQKASFPRSLKVGIVWLRVKPPFPSRTQFK